MAPDNFGSLLPGFFKMAKRDLKIGANIWGIKEEGGWGLKRTQRYIFSYNAILLCRKFRQMVEGSIFYYYLLFRYRESKVETVSDLFK